MASIINGDIGTPTTLTDTLYSVRSSSVILDKNYLGIWVAVAMVAVIYVLLVPVIKKRDLLVYMFVMIISGAAIFLGIWGMEWDVHKIEVAETPYKVLADFEIRCEVGIRIGLQGFNVTLLGLPRVQFGEIIDYNEHFTWTWSRSVLLEDFEGALLRGVPIPIISVAELIELDGEMIQFGRKYRVAGYWTFIFMVWAFPLWLISLVFAAYDFQGHTRKYAGNMLFGVATCFLVAVGVYSRVKPNNFAVPFSGEELVFLRPQFGFNFWFTVVSLIICVIEGIYLIASTTLVWESEEKPETGSVSPNAFRRFTQQFWHRATAANLQETFAEYREEDEREEDDSHMYDPSMFAKSAKQRKISRGDVEIELEPPKSSRSRGSSRASDKGSEKDYGSPVSHSPHPGNKMDPLIVPWKGE